MCNLFWGCSMGAYDIGFEPITFKQYKDRTEFNPYGKVSVYITPGGDIFDCRGMVGSHTDFTDMVYRNLSMLGDITDEFGNKIYDSVMGDKDVVAKSKVEACSQVRERLIEGIGLQEEDPRQLELLESRLLYTADDDLLVQDLGFIKVGLIPKLGSMAICVPSSGIHGHRPTGAQRATLFDIAQFHFYDYDDISDTYREACRKSEAITAQIESALDNDDIM